jgi:hypothetical protein
MMAVDLPARLVRCMWCRPFSGELAGFPFQRLYDSPVGALHAQKRFRSGVASSVPVGLCRTLLGGHRNHLVTCVLPLQLECSSPKRA